MNVAKRTAAFSIALLCASLVFSQQFEPNWRSLNQRKIPAWFHQEKFGIFIHWGLYAVPSYAPVIPNSGSSYAEWYWYRIQEKHKDFISFHHKNFGPAFQYPQFEPLFKAEMFNPKQWAEVFKKSGARYVVLTSKHHEGYTLWNSVEADKAYGRPWNAVTGTPKRDLLGELTNAVRSEGMRMGYYYSLYEWFNPLWTNDKQRFVAEHMIPQFKDLVTRYKPSIIFSDGEWDLSDTAWRSPELLAWLFNESPVAKDVVVNDRWGKNTRAKNTNSTYATSEYGSGMNADVIWEESRGIGHSYGYNRNEQLADYKSSHELLLMLVDVVSRGGNLLLDIGPTADGRIPVIMQQRLTDIGKWLTINGEAIYNTTAWKRSYEWSEGKQPEKKEESYMAGHEIKSLIKPKKDQAFIEHFYTRKGSSLYCVVPGFRLQLRLRNFRAKSGAKAVLLGTAKLLPLKQVGSDCVIDLSSIRPGEVDAELFVIKVQNALQ